MSVYATHKWQILHLENDAAFYLLFLFCLLNSFHPIKVVIGHPSWFNNITKLLFFLPFLPLPSIPSPPHLFTPIFPFSFLATLLPPLPFLFFPYPLPLSIFLFPPPHLPMFNFFSSIPMPPLLLFHSFSSPPLFSTSIFQFLPPLPSFPLFPISSLFHFYSCSYPISLFPIFSFLAFLIYILPPSHPSPSFHPPWSITSN